MWVKSRKVGPGKRQQRWDDGPLAMREREAQRRRRLQPLLKQRVEQHRRVIAAIGKAEGRGDCQSSRRDSLTFLRQGHRPVRWLKDKSPGIST